MSDHTARIELERKEEKMSKMKNAIEAIANCEMCNGLGYEGWANGEDFDIEWCDCNPQHLTNEDFYQVAMEETCIGCNENKVSWDALYCYTCYLANNAEIDYTEMDKLWTTQEAN